MVSLRITRICVPGVPPELSGLVQKSKLIIQMSAFFSFCGEISMSLLFIQVDLILIKILIQKILTCNLICWNSFSPCSNLCSCFPIGQKVHLFFPQHWNHLHFTLKLRKYMHVYRIGASETRKR